MEKRISTISKQQLYNESCDFTLFPDGNYFIEHSLTNLVWNQGQNTLTVFKGMYSDYCNIHKTPCGRYDGSYTINSKIGTEFKFITS